MSEEKIREKQLRKLAAQQGLRMVKSGRHDPRALDDDGYVLVNVATNHVVAGPGAVGEVIGKACGHTRTCRSTTLRHI